MIKKVLLPAILGVNFLTAQCMIDGKSTIRISEEEVYTINRATAQCEDCHLWVTIGGNASFSIDNKKNTVKLKAGFSGRQVLSATVLTQDGVAQCSKNIDIVDAKTQMPNQSNANVSTNSSNCDIEVSDYKEVKSTEGIVSFFPNVTNSSYQYNWTATYFNGDVMTSDLVNPQFPYSKTKGIKSVSVKVTSNRCIKRFSKNYEENFWRFF